MGGGGIPEDRAASDTDDAAQYRDADYLIPAEEAAGLAQRDADWERRYAEHVARYGTGSILFPSGNKTR
jgi:hypothetical protein